MTTIHTKKYLQQLSEKYGNEILDPNFLNKVIND